VDARPVFLQEVSVGTIAIPLLLVIGALLAVQAAANVQLATAMASPIAASALQLAIGASLLVALTLAVGTLAAFDRLPSVTPWHLAGGLASALYITAGIVVFPRLGAVVTVGLFVTGQVLTSVLLDGLGLLGLQSKPITIVTVVGLAAVLTGAAVVVRAQGGTEALRQAGRERAPWLVFALLAGAGLPIQGAINAQLRLDLREPFSVAAFSFIVATAATWLVLIASQVLGGSPRPQVGRLREVPWWAWVGGFVGASYVTSVFLLVPVIGVAPTVALTIAGQQLASLTVDRYGLLRLRRRPIIRARLAGVAVLLVGVALLQLAGR
jgi:transporter family-2 protein